MRKHFNELLEKLVTKHGIRVHHEELKLQLFSHPSYPSLHALTGVLDHFGISNLALRLPTDEETLLELPNCFIANILKEKEEYLVLVEKKNAFIEISFDKGKTERLSQEEFLAQWDGIILAVEREGEVEQLPSNRSDLLRYSVFSLGIVVLSFLLYSNLGLFAGAHFILSVIGLILSVFIVRHEFGMESTAVNNFCNLSANTSCDAVLNSKAAQVFKLFKLSDISIVVFASYVLNWSLLYLAGISNVSLIALTTIIAIPIVLYSVYYQYFIVKKWCPLCLSIAAILCFQFVVLFGTGFSIAALSFTAQTALLLLFSLFVVIGFWDFVKTSLEKNKSLKELQLKHFKFKRNFSLFNTLYQESPSLSSAVNIPGEIILGNPNGALELILVTSPMCFYCKDAHTDVEQLLKSYREQLRVVIRFNFRALNKEDQSYQVCTKLLQIFDLEGPKSIEQSLQEVYSKDIDLQQWLGNQNKVLDNQYDQIIDQQHNWCKANKINFTPAFFVNGKAFPKEYDREELGYFIEDLIEQKMNSASELEEARIS